MNYSQTFILLIFSLILNFTYGQNKIDFKKKKKAISIQKNKLPNSQQLKPIKNLSVIRAGIAQVETAIPAFIGYTKQSWVNKPTKVRSFLEYSRIFGKATEGFYLYESVKLFFENGGRNCYIIPVGSTSGPIQSGDLERGLRASQKVEAQMVVIPDAVGLPDAGFYNLQEKMLNVCKTKGDRFAILNTLEPSGNVNSDINDFRNGFGIRNLNYGAVYYPWLEMDGGMTIPPAGAIAGIMARVDRDRGVWKAPANVSLSGILNPSVSISSSQTDMMNVDVNAGKSVNAIRRFTGKGILVWGARTLAGNDNEWRYVPVRRTAIMIEESVKRGTKWAISEPNDANTWIQVKTQIENFMTTLWRDGALAGSKPEQAFFVKCGLNETMTSQDIQNGRMNIEIGMAVVRPAEFIVLKIELKME